MLKGSVDEERFDEVAKDSQPEDEAETLLVGFVAEEFLTGDGSGPAAEQRKYVQRLLGNTIAAFLLCSAFVDAVDDERCQTHHSEPDGANDDRILTHCVALISSDVNFCGQLAD